MIRYMFYATLLDAYQGYLDSDKTWEKYWGHSENPPHSPEEFHQMQYQSLIDRINRVPFESEAMDKGTAFNEVIDCLVNGCNSERMELSRVYDEKGELQSVKALFNGHEFLFPIKLCKEFAEYYKGALTQQYLEAELPTMYGKVKLYGYPDYIMPFSIHDLKTTKTYAMGNYKHHWQHVVYPYAMRKNGCDVRDFEYNVAEIGKTFYRTYTESYAYVPERDVPRLTLHCEDLIRFLEQNKSKKPVKKIFNLI